MDLFKVGKKVTFLQISIVLQGKSGFNQINEIIFLRYFFLFMFPSEIIQSVIIVYIKELLKEEER